MKTGLLSTALVLAVALPLPAASPPAILNHQGRISVAFQNYEGLGYFKFAFVDGAGTTTYWSNDGTSTNGGEPTAAVETPVALGHYGIPLGDTSLTNMTAIPPAVFADNDDVRLRVWFGSVSTGPFQLLSPDRRITSAGYALNATSAVTAGEAQSVADNSISTSKLAAGSVTEAILAAGAVTTAKLAAGAINALDSPDGLSSSVLEIDDAGRVGIGTDGTLATTSNPNLIPLDDLANEGSVKAENGIVYQVNLGQTTAFRLDGDNRIETLGTVPVGAPFGRFDVEGNRVALIDGTVLRICDFSDPANPTVTAGFLGAVLAPTGVALRGNVVFFTTPGSNGLSTYDITDPANPVLLDDLALGLNQGDDPLISGDYAYVFVSSVERLYTVNISDPSSLVLEGTLPWPFAVSPDLHGPAVLDGSTLYVGFKSGSSYYLASYDLSDPANPAGSHVAELGADLGFSFSVAGPYAYVESAEAVETWDVSVNPPVRVNRRSLAPFEVAFDGIAIDGDHLWLSVADSGTIPENRLQVLGLASRTVHAGALELAGASSLVLSDRSSLLFADGSTQTRAFGSDAVTSAEIVDGSVTLADLDTSSVGLALSGDSLSISEGGAPANLGGYFNDDGSEDFSGQLNVVGGPLRIDNNRAYAALDSSGNLREMLKKTVNDETAIATAQNEDITFKDGSNTNMVITGDNGYAGIGEVDPLARLHIRNSDTGYSVSNSADLYIEDADASIFLLSTEGGVTGSSVSLVEVNSGTGAFTDRWTMNRQTTDGSGDSSLNFIYNDGASTTAASLSTSGDLTIAGSLFPTSDRAAKENFREVDPAGILEKVIAMPVTRWNYRTTPGIEHIGPVAQDFHAAFSTGIDDRHISTTDADGVALAAIQGLNEKVEETNRRLREENKMLRSRLENLERRLEALAGQVP